LIASLERLKSDLDAPAAAGQLDLQRSSTASLASNTCHEDQDSHSEAD
jgi:hypothetical protein